tara:strand:+ start:212 stop:556 length:345 start_codon:yes stop_codon:yes gene_type:complete
LQPTNWALPPAGFVRVAPHTAQAIVVVAREKMMLSLEQSRHETFRKLAVISFTSVVYKFEFLGTLARCIVRLSGFCAAEKDVHALSWLLTAIRLWTWETTVSSHDSAETALTPL